MAAFCVNTRSKLFKDTAKRLDISEDQLELIAYKYGNQEGTYGKFPSDDYIIESLRGKQDVNASEAQVKLWELRYSEPRVFETIDEANQFIQDTKEYFDKDSITLVTTNEGKFRVSVAEPFNQEAYQKEIDSIKEKAIADGTFMKAPNGNQSNLNEQQWLQVRTKAFKRWFGDWENDPANASKAVDENGEPQVFYHGTGEKFSTFDLRFFGQTDYGDRGVGFYFAYNKRNAESYGNIIMPVFLNIRTPYNGSDHYDAYINRGKTKEQIIEDTKKFVLSKAERTIKYMIDQRNSGNTSAYFDENFTKNSTDADIRNKVLSEANRLIGSLSEEIGNLDMADGYLKGSYEALVTNPNQIKSAIENRGTFSSKAPNIYFGESPLESQESANTDRSNFRYTRINRAFRDTLIKHLSEDSFPQYYNERRKKALVDLANGLFDFFDREGFRLLITNNSYDGVNPGSVVSTVGKTAIIYYKEDKAQGGKYLNILHEMLHVATLQAISFDSEGRVINDDVLQGYYTAFVNHLTLDEEFMKYHKLMLSGKYKTYEERDAEIPLEYQILNHAFSSPGEFISCCISNKEVQQVLESITWGETQSEKSLWQEMREWFKGILEKIFHGSSYLDHADFLDEVTRFLTDVKYTGEGDALFTPEILTEITKEREAIWNSATEFGSTVQPSQPVESEPLLAPPSVEREFHAKSTQLISQIDNLFSGDIDASEISAEANKAVDWISDQLTQYMENHELVYNKFYRDNESAPPKEEVMKKLGEVSSRKEMLEMLGLDKMIEFYTEEVLSETEENADLFDYINDAELDKLDAVKENIKGLIQLGYARFLGREGFGFHLSDVEGETFAVSEEVSKEDQINPDDFNGQADIDGNEEVRNQQEHWMIENATRDIMDNASTKVKQAIADCYLLEDNGKIDENGNKKYDNTKDFLNRNERVVPIQAVRSIVKWIQGATTLSQMTARLEARLNTNPWISQIVTRLKDTTGNEADFQSQFFNTFCKHFQPYSIVKKRADGTFYTMIVNAHPALTDAMNALSVQFKTGAFSLVNEEGIVQMSNVENLAYLRDSLQSQGTLSEENRENVVEIIGRILEAIGMPQPNDAINRILTNTLKDVVWANTKNIIEKLTAASKEVGYNPFQYSGNKNSIRGYISNIIQPFTNQLEDVLVSSVYDSGKMYQSYITPSWTTKLFTKMHLPDKEFRQFIFEEFGNSEWFVENPEELASKTEEERFAYLKDHPEIWRIPWIGELISMDETTRQKAFQHKVQLNFNKQNYMRGMNDLEYVLSVYTEYFAEKSDSETDVLFGNYRFPMISNKPSNEFVRFARHTGIDGRTEILDGLTKIFHQELSRIQTVEKRNLKKGDAGYIANFDANEGKGKGLQFNFLDYLNEYLNGNKKDKALGKLIDRKLHGTEKTQLTSEELDEMDSLVKNEITTHLDGLARKLVTEYRNNGLFEALKGIEHIGKSDYAVEDAIKEFVWNDNYAQANILEMLITDKAFYKNEEDLQKRLAQVHSPGIRGNWEATDFKGNPISDGKVRVAKLADFAGKQVMLNTLSNIETVFDRKIAENPEDAEGWGALKESIVAAFKDVNVVDGQAFVGPTAYRKKAFAFGEWTKDDEEIYKLLKQGKANLAQVKKVFNPRKPFTYGKVNKSVSAGLDTPIKTLNYGVQYKDSEYLLIMADALLKGQETGRPNLLGALFDVMEESAASNPTRGIDFIVFESGVKTGLTGAISINEFVDDPNGKEKAFTKIWNSVFREDGSYNEDFVDELNAEDYTTQQTVPEHFMHGDLQWGSQVRVIMPSDLETSFNGEEVLYDYIDPLTGEKKPMRANEIREAWEKNTAAMVQKGIDKLSEELGLSEDVSPADRNILISKLLQREILSNQRYGVDLLLACSVDENGNFRIPLGDPIQSKRIEQLLNSIIKNRINKQKVAGGTLVEVTNFGTSKRLEIRFKDKSDPTGNTLLASKAEYLAKGHTEDEFKDYVKNNQGGIAYYECYAPAWTRSIFQKFTDEKGNVDVEAIEMLDPDLLKMFGYRIPTEDKYSTAPYKIVGFLPQEAGDGFMQPWETTVIDGSDFDVDKKNLMRMALELKSKLLSKREFLEKEGLTENDESTEKYKKYRRQAVSAKTIYDKLGDRADISLSEEERKEAEWYEKSRYKRDRKALKEERDARNEQAEEAFERRYREDGLDKLDAAIKELESKEDLTAAEEEKLAEYNTDYEKRYERLNKSIDKARESNEKWYKEAVEKRRQKLPTSIEKSIEVAKREKKIEIIRNILNQGIFRDSSTIPENQRAIFLAVKQAYLDSMFEVVRPKEGTKDHLNNKMFNMQWAIATHASTADKMLNPGNFDAQKRMGYMVAANRLGHSWAKLEAMKTDDIKDLVFTTKNLMDFDVQTQFYKQNAVAGQILGIFAVAKSAHAMFEGRGYHIMVDSPFTIDGMNFAGAMEYDVKYDRNGVTLVGKHLGSLVGASADAVKDPVLNFMNINKETINVLNTALRFGLDFDTASLLLSSGIVGRVIDQYRRKSLSEKSSFDREIKAALRQYENLDYIGEDSPLKRQDLTRKEMIWAITGRIRENDERASRKANEINYKILNAVYQLSQLSKRAQPLTDLSRLNSITSAPGPLYIDTIASDRKLGPAVSMDGIVKTKAGYKDAEGHIIKVGSSYVGDVEVTENNINELTYEGKVQYFTDYESVTRETVFDELPSLKAFYESYNIAKRLFKGLNFTTASKAFTEDVLGAVPESMEFALYNKEKLLSSLADFFQSYILVQSKVIDSSQLKGYVQNFVKEFIKNDYKSKYRNNPFIQAIQPALISKEGEPDRYTLKIETTGMEQSEKDALSAGWIQLEKQDPELSHKLFAYSFFKGGIGFNPKTFMGLVPIQVKERIQGYIDAYTHIPSVDGATVIDQWVRNNWTNADLVPSIKTRFKSAPDAFITEKKYVFNTPAYIRVTVNGTDYLYRQISVDDKNVSYKMIEPLGNNGEYLEMYGTDEAVTPFDHPQRGVLELKDTDRLDEKVDDPTLDTPTVQEQTRELVDFYQTAYDTETTQERQKESNDEAFDEANKNLDITVNKDKFDQILGEFC